MLLEEFEALTGFYPDQLLYEMIEKEYMESHKTKEEFCKDYLKNRDGLANKAQRSASLILAKEKMENEKKIANLNKEIEGLKEALEKELEWKPYEFRRNVSQKEYDKMVAEENMVRLNDEQCKNILSDWFGFVPERVTILHRVPCHEINRHNLVRNVGMVVRDPLYFSTDWNYIRFDCGLGSYELYNGTLRLYYD
mgnify:CR=1 FL=1